MEQFPWWLSGKVSTYQSKRSGFNPWVGRIPWRCRWQPTSEFFSGKFHGQGSLVGSSLWGCRELDLIEQANNNKTWKQFKCISTDGWINKMWCTHPRHGSNASVYQRMDKQNVVYTSKGILVRLKKEGNSDIYYNLDKLLC